MPKPLAKQGPGEPRGGSESGSQPGRGCRAAVAGDCPALGQGSRSAPSWQPVPRGSSAREEAREARAPPPAPPPPSGSGRGGRGASASAGARTPGRPSAGPGSAQRTVSAEDTNPDAVGRGAAGPGAGGPRYFRRRHFRVAASLWAAVPPAPRGFLAVGDGSAVVARRGGRLGRLGAGGRGCSHAGRPALGCCFRLAGSCGASQSGWAAPANSFFLWRGTRFPHSPSFPRTNSDSSRILHNNEGQVCKLAPKLGAPEFKMSWKTGQGESLVLQVSGLGLAALGFLGFWQKPDKVFQVSGQFPWETNQPQACLQATMCLYPACPRFIRVRLC